MNLPHEFESYTRCLLGPDGYTSLLNGLGQDPTVSIRLNPAKAVATIPAEEAQPVPWCDNAFYLSRRPAFTFDPLFHAGTYYVQEASSMFLGRALQRYVSRPVVALDLCAAPGGKSTHARSILPEGSLLVSNEPIRTRARVLAENMVKWGHPSCIVTNNYPADFAGLDDFFDVIIADVPCSGEGMFRKDEEAIANWSPSNVELCWKRQREILSDIWPALKPGGLLIYSTCTFNTLENEENVAWIAQTLQAEVLPLDPPAEWRITGNLAGRQLSESTEPGTADFPVYHFLPGTTQGEGFFMAVLRKCGEEFPETYTTPVYPRPCKNKDKNARRNSGAAPAPPAECRTWIRNEREYRFVTEGNTLSAFPENQFGRLEILQKRLTLLHAGIPIAEYKGRDWIPVHALAMSTQCRTEAFASVALTYEQAVAYLRTEAVTLPSDTPRGYVLLTYRNVPLGFAKQVGNRANNLYPQEWRIRSGHIIPCDLWN